MKTVTKSEFAKHVFCALVPGLPTHTPIQERQCDILKSSSAWQKPKLLENEAELSIAYPRQLFIRER
jgi:hypothetical protein